ncbi:MAG TPA: dUTP diphosphatase [Acidimicrobiales bacterium]|nr:MAG: deoxyuridine 5'-triphosphate nucleotidohydrolase [Actinobacteria bacterium 21-64-8]HQU00601.1 dUTP diphosphatase [Acidimicrobiales bacterium]
MELAFSMLHPDAKIPHYAHDGDAGMDLVAVDEQILAPGGGRAMISTGLAVAIPEGFAGLVLPRSGLATRHGVTCANSPGLIDSGYRGEVRVALVNHDPEVPYHVHPGDRVAQLVIVAVPAVSPRLVAALPDTARGTGGFGSTGR